MQVTYPYTKMMSWHNYVSKHLYRKDEKEKLNLKQIVNKLLTKSKNQTWLYTTSIALCLKEFRKTCIFIKYQIKKKTFYINGFVLRTLHVNSICTEYNNTLYIYPLVFKTISYILTSDVHLMYLFRIKVNLFYFFSITK